MFDGKVLMITGGTGSFGQTVLRRFLSTGVNEIRIFSRDEKKQEDMRIAFNDAKLKFYIGDVRDYDSVQKAMRGVDYVFHAAALKQVPSCEFYPMEAVRTNIIGTEHVLAAASSTGVQRLVVLSTDKAVYPINTMGISKAMAEKVMVAAARMHCALGWRAASEAQWRGSARSASRRRERPSRDRVTYMQQFEFEFNLIMKRTAVHCMRS